MKFKDCGVRGNKFLFMCPSKIALYSDDQMTEVIMVLATHICHWVTLIIHVTLIMMQPTWRMTGPTKTF